MDQSKVHTAPSINGHMIALGAGHSIAIYERNRECYVAEFLDGGERLEYGAHGSALTPEPCGATTDAPLSGHPCL